jgi:hypothetical protein
MDAKGAQASEEDSSLLRRLRAKHSGFQIVFIGTFKKWTFFINTFNSASVAREPHEQGALSATFRLLHGQHLFA